jgi:N utilization substance protein B
MPKKVIINEALELARTYGSDDSVKFVNGLLDGITRRLEEDKERGERKEERGKRKEEGEASPRTTDDTPRDATTDDDRQDD